MRPSMQGLCAWVQAVQELHRGSTAIICKATSISAQPLWYRGMG